jgi:triacylglycerol esterase/lipase EstA (alpha/beta hydrolase family)
MGPFELFSKQHSSANTLTTYNFKPTPLNGEGFNDVIVLDQVCKDQNTVQIRLLVIQFTANKPLASIMSWFPVSYINRLVAQNMKQILLYLLLLYLLSSCAYMKSVSVQDKFLQNQKTNPGQYNLKHIIDHDTLIIYGLIMDDSGKYTNQSLSVAAYSDQFSPHELVDVTHFASIGTHYVLNLPEGKYDLLVLADKDNDKNLEESEVVGLRQDEFNFTTSTAKVLTGIDINLAEKRKVDWKINIAVPEVPEIANSLVFPKGSIRWLDDPIFGQELSTLGMYEPAAFLERAPTNFYTLEEYLPYKVPVIFVHGMGGTVREFIQIIEKMDREYYVPWFFYYPSGRDLNQLAENFYNLFLSGKLVPNTGPHMIIVAHSMGGLVVREALNLQQGSESENMVALYISIASPFGGHPDAASSVKHAPMVLQSWRDLDPNGQFINQLFRKPLPESVQHQLLYTYANPDTLKLGENSDGVVPLYSQLLPVAQIQSSKNFGFNSSHTSVLKDTSAINHIINSFQSVKGLYSEPHVRAMQLGGYDVELSDGYNNQEKYLITVLGKYLAALSEGKLVAETPFEEHFIEVFQGSAEASRIAEKAWLKFTEEYPQIVEIQ